MLSLLDVVGDFGQGRAFGFETAYKNIGDTNCK
jgi:hypothetical protein